MDDSERERMERWLRTDTVKNVFPREVGKYRDVAHDWDGFEKWFGENRDSEFCWSSVYSTDQVNKSCFDTIFLDFDVYKKYGSEAALLLIRNALDVLVDIFPRVRLYYSGVKGFHVYLDFGREIFFYNFRDVARKLVYDLVANYVLPDMAAVGDVRRMARIVGNVRTRGGVERRMLELCSCCGVDEWVRCIIHGDDSVCGGVGAIDMNHDRGVDMLITFDERLADEIHSDVENRILSTQSLDNIPPCVANCFTELVNTGELNHGGRVLLANWLIWAGFGEDEVVDVFRAAKDFKEHYTRYQVEFLVRKKYKLPSCKKIMAEGYCPYRCELYPWMQGTRKNDDV